MTKCVEGGVINNQCIRMSANRRKEQPKTILTWEVKRLLRAVLFRKVP